MDPITKTAAAILSIESKLEVAPDFYVADREDQEVVSEYIDEDQLFDQQREAQLGF